MAKQRQHWLLKSEPGAFSIDDLRAAPGQTTGWDGVRNYQARNFLRAMRTGDLAFYYHSGTTPPALVGLATIALPAYPDPTQFDPRDAHYDPKSKMDNPTWSMVDVRFLGKFKRPLTLEDLRAAPALEGMELLRRGSRLSVQPVTPAQWQAVMQLAVRLT